MSNEASLALPSISPVDPVLAMTAAIVAGYLGANPVKMTDLSRVVRTVHQTLADIAGNVPAEPAPSVDARQSVFRGHIVCLECGHHLKTLRRHLSETHSLTPEKYRAKWDLAENYPMVAPDYSKARSRMAKTAGLGKNRPAR